MKTITRMFILLLLAVIIGCTTKVDTTKDFTMTLNGSKYNVGLGMHLALISEIESGFGVTNSFYILFPIRSLNPLKLQGFKLTFSPSAVETGRALETHAGDKNYDLVMTYDPALGHRFNEGLMLTYSSRAKQGMLRVVFDVLEPGLHGRVKGKILYAALYGFYESQDKMEPAPLDKEKKLEIYNFPFDARFGLSPL
ncbi:MAG: hypothetical protein L0Y73_02940 [Candidatus Aminicenantes bacterium]|nr:hypothetical protein [Candidatus Aminicenantes bacterium]